MGTVFFLFCLLFIFVRSDLGLKLRILFRSPALQEYLETTQKKTARLIFSLVQRTTGFRITVDPFDGPPLPSTVLIVTNHQSLADIPVLIFAFPRHRLRFVTKRELGLGIPMVSPYLRAGGSALISRKGNFARGMRELAKLAKLSEEGISPIVFPEGHRSRTGRLQKFQAGAFRILLERAHLPVLIVAMDGGFRISRLSRVFTMLGKTRYHVRAIALYPPPRGKKETLELLERAQSDIESQIRAWRGIKKPIPDTTSRDGSER
jgi:1-acyl-sn-glycerol-3-phosphate acyltransferase